MDHGTEAPPLKEITLIQTAQDGKRAIRKVKEIRGGGILVENKRKIKRGTKHH